MKTATLRELLSNSSALVDFIEAGEEVAITQGGKRVARLVPDHEDVLENADWSKSAAIIRDRSGARTLTAEESAYILREASGKW